MLISVLFIKVTCEWHRAVNCNCKVPRIRVIFKLTVRSTIHHTGMLSGDVTRPPAAELRVDKNPTDSYRFWTRRKSTIINCHYLPNRSTLDIGVLGFFGIVWHNEHPAEVWSVPPVTPYTPYTPYTPCHIPEQRRSQLQRCRKYKIKNTTGGNKLSWVVRRQRAWHRTGKTTVCD